MHPSIHDMNSRPRFPSVQHFCFRKARAVDYYPSIPRPWPRWSPRVGWNQLGFEPLGSDRSAPQSSKKTTLWHQFAWPCPCPGVQYRRASTSANCLPTAPDKFPQRSVSSAELGRLSKISLKAGLRSRQLAQRIPGIPARETGPSEVILCSIDRQLLRPDDEDSQPRRQGERTNHFRRSRACDQPQHFCPCW